MLLIKLDASGWRTANDFFYALLPRLGAPDWHGHSLDALDDSLLGNINRVEPPFSIEVHGSENLSPEVTAFLTDVSEVFVSARAAYNVDVAFKVL